MTLHSRVVPTRNQYRLHLTTTDFIIARISSDASEKVADVAKWTAGRAAVRQQHIDNATHATILSAMGSFIPEVFHRRHEMRDKNTRHLRAVLDYILFLQNPEDSEAAIQRRTRKEPHLRNDVLKTLRDTIPSEAFDDISWYKELVEDNDVATIVMAAQSLLLQLTEDKSGDGLTGSNIFAGITFVKGEVSRSREGSSLDPDESTLMNTTLTQDTDKTLESDLVLAIQPLSARSTETTATEMLNSYLRPIDLATSPGKRMFQPNRQVRSHQRSLTNKRTALGVRGQPSKRTRINDNVDQEDPLQAQIDGERTGKGVPKARSTSTAINQGMLESPSQRLAELEQSIYDGMLQPQHARPKAVEESTLREVVEFTSIANPIRQIEQAVKTLQEEVVALRTKLAQTADVEATNDKQKIEMACLKEAKKASAEKMGRLEDEVAVIRALAKSNGVTEDQINEQLASMSGL